MCTRKRVTIEISGLVEESENIMAHPSVRADIETACISSRIHINELLSEVLYLRKQRYWNYAQKKNCGKCIEKERERAFVERMDDESVEKVANKQKESRKANTREATAEKYGIGC